MLRVLHIFNSVSGGATVGALELIRTSRDSATGIKHFAVYPGIGPMESVIRELCDDSAVIPMRWWNEKTHLDPIRRSVIWMRENQITRFGLKTRRRLRERLRDWKIDVVHSNTACVIDGALVAHSLNLPHVWHIRERIGHDGFMQFNLSDNGLANRIGSLSDKIIPMSRFVGEIFHRHGLKNKSNVVYDGVDPILFDSDEARQRGIRLRQSWGIPDDAVLFGNVGSVCSQVKRHDLFIQAAAIVRKQYSHIYFVICGSLPRLKSWTRRTNWNYFQRLKHLAEEAGLSDRLIWADNVEDTGAMMNAIDVLVHACDLEGFGRVAIEAMTAGKPVIGPDRGGLTESVIDEETGILFQSGNQQAMAHAIGQLAEDLEKRTCFGQAGRKRVDERFLPQHHLESMLTIYEDLTNRHGSTNSSIESAAKALT